MPESSYPMIDVADIIRMVGGAAFQRGQVYARDDLVQGLSFEPDSRMLSARVLGSSPAPYRTQLYLVQKGDGRYHLRDSACSCPIAMDCKHVAAVALRSNIENLRTSQELTAPKPPAGPAGWQESLTGLLSAREHDDGALTEVPPTAMGLQFDMRPVTGPAGHHRRGYQGFKLGVRPVIRNSKGNWVKNNLAWGNISYQTYGLRLDPDQHRWFAQFPALHRGTGVSYFGNNDSWLHLDDFSNPLLWQLLAEARRLGIAFVGSKKSVRVHLAGQAVLLLDATTEDGEVHLCPAINIDGENHSPQTAHLIGNHGIYTVSGDDVITLAPTTRKLTEQNRELIERTRPVRIPEAEKQEFLTGFYPRLIQSIDVVSSDGSVTFPEILPPTLVLTATYTGEQLELHWDWAYLTGGTETRRPLKDSNDDGAYRDAAAEAAALQAARDALGGRLVKDRVLTDMEMVDFTEGVLPRLEQAEGVRVDVVGNKPTFTELTETPQLVISTVDTEDRDWFDLGVLVTVEGRKVPFDHIFTALAKGINRIKLVDNSYLSLKQPIFDQLRQLIDEAQALNEWETGLRINRYQATLWAEFEDLAEETEQAQAWRTAVQGLLSLTELTPVQLPSGLQASLRPYQVDGFNWLAFLWSHGLGGVLADDMGLGKTLQTLALLVHAKEQGETRPFLVVAPTSVVPNWVAEAGKFAPGLRVTGITDTQAKSGVPLKEQVEGADVVITSYTLFRLDNAAYGGQDWAGLILDEAQFVKNHAAKIHRCAKELPAPFKLAITGTPMENNLMELWAMFSITAPGLFPSSRAFTEEYRTPIEKQGNTERLQRLRRRIRPLMMRRTKESVAADLPPKQEQVLAVDLHPRHRKIYQTHLQRERQKLLGLIEDLDRNRMIVFRSLTLLRMLSLDASLVEPEYEGVPSAKLDVLFEQLEDVLAEGHRALIFSQFTSYLKRAAARLDQQGIQYAYLDGSTRKRAEVIDSFKNGPAPVFLISLKAGGFGLNLTEADYCFLLDPWWNPASESQAVDRTHRIGQTRNVMVYRMVSSDTIEEKVMKLKEQKAKLFSSVMDDDAVFSSALTADDIKELLAG
ncbi:helicase [Arthrobacter sp. JZ12]|uniref:DEAD/DEAH box helicase n=1 Tax=Arthrobacter sp. JZ12 TaxID=2654190 RepID=UPI002B48BBFD|nr:DEAD/DEAH box helicase [Arthrobacter sp. JZ12]WRH24130.1 helicase [Arthrobacter sp. JZ12]